MTFSLGILTGQVFLSGQSPQEALSSIQEMFLESLRDRFSSISSRTKFTGNQGLMDVYATWVLTEEEFRQLWMKQQSPQRFSLIEYCAHDEEICQDAWEQELGKEIDILMYYSVDHYWRPVLQSTKDQMYIRLWDACLSTYEEKEKYHNFLYTEMIPTTRIELYEVGVALDLGEDFTACITEQDAMFYVLQSIKQARDMFSITTFPSYIMLDNTTKKRVLIPGLYGLREVGEVMTKELNFEGLE